MTATQTKHTPFASFAPPVREPSALRRAVTGACRREEGEAMAPLIEAASFPGEMRDSIRKTAADLVEMLRAKQKQQAKLGGVDALMYEYSLSSLEGVALMCLAEALLRIPDKATADALLVAPPFVAERGRDGFTYSGIFAEEQRVARQDRNLATQAGEGLGQLHRDHRCPDHRQTLGKGVAGQGVGRGPIGRASQPRYRWNGGTRAGPDEDTIESDLALAAIVLVNNQGLGITEAGPAADNRNGRVAF
mgnify:CR=1 FL=1